MITRPVYGPFSTTIESCGRRIVNSDLIHTDGYYTMDFEDIERKAASENVRIFLLCNPQNPTGRVWSMEELRTLAGICEQNGVLLISDEVHCDIVRKGVHFVTAAKAGKPENTIVLNGINKTFNCAGLQCSNAIIQDETLRHSFQVKAGMLLPSPRSMIQEAFFRIAEQFEDVR